MNVPLVHICSTISQLLERVYEQKLTSPKKLNVGSNLSFQSLVCKEASKDMTHDGPLVEPLVATTRCSLCDIVKLSIA